MKLSRIFAIFLAFSVGIQASASTLLVSSRSVGDGYRAGLRVSILNPQDQIYSYKFESCKVSAGDLNPTCELIGEETGYTKIEIQNRIDELNRASNGKTAWVLVGAAVGALVGGVIAFQPGERDPASLALLLGVIGALLGGTFTAGVVGIIQSVDREFTQSGETAIHAIEPATTLEIVDEDMTPILSNLGRFLAGIE
jgi:hypothetical protein